MSDELQTGRKMLSPRWDDIDFERTDQAIGVPLPLKFKPSKDRATTIDLVPKECWHFGQISVIDAVLQRRSNRKFSSRMMSFEALSLLLYCTQGVHRQTEKATFRTAPSAGARHSFETYVYADRVDNLEKGIYRYLPENNQICLEEKHRPEMKEELEKATYDQLYGAAMYFIWTTIPYRMEWRYSTVSAKLIAIDIGHVCENLYLACEAVGAGTCAIGAYNQELVDYFIGVDGVDEFAIYMAPVGML